MRSENIHAIIILGINIQVFAIAPEYTVKHGIGVALQVTCGSPNNFIIGQQTEHSILFES